MESDSGLNALQMHFHHGCWWRGIPHVGEGEYPYVGEGEYPYVGEGENPHVFTRSIYYSNELAEGSLTTP